MKRIIKPFAIMFSAVILATSCLDDDTDNNITYYDDTAITSFSLGTLNRYLVTKATSSFDDEGNPEDSVYTVTVTGSDYKFHIDQETRRIYNTDSLPMGTDAAHVICNVSSKNAGIVVIKDVDSDTLRYYSDTDSVDFSQPREFQVYSTSGKTHRSYMISVNVHKEDPDSFKWVNKGANPAFASLRGMKAVTFNGKVMVYGSDGNSTLVYTTSTGDGTSWTGMLTGARLDADAWKSMTVHGNAMFTVSGGSLMVSADGLAWQDANVLNGVTGAPVLSRLIGAGNVKLYAIDANGDILSSDNHGVVWQNDGLGDEKSQLPAENISMAVMPLNTNSDAERVIMAGNRDLDAYPADSSAVVWNKIEEYADGSEEHKWIPCNEENKHRLPRLSNLKMLKYGDVLIAIGGQGQGTSTAKAFSQIYVSEDNGLTWHSDDKYVLPEEFTNNGSNVFTMTTDKDNFLWIICGGDGTVWRGRLNKLGWTDYQTSFTK